MKFLRWDSPFMQKLALVGNLIGLNVLWVICSLPIITAGAATAAMYHTVFQFQTADETEVIRPFFRGFRKNFKQATLLWIPTLLITAVLLLSVRYYIFAVETHVALQAIVILGSAIFLMLQTQLIPLITRFETKLSDALKNSILLSILHFPSSVIMTLLNALPIAIFLVFTVQFMQWLPLWVGVWFSLVAYINARMLLKIWKKHMPEEQKEEIPEEVQE